MRHHRGQRGRDRTDHQHGAATRAAAMNSHTNRVRAVSALLLVGVIGLAAVRLADLSAVAELVLSIAAWIPILAATLLLAMGRKKAGSSRRPGK